MLQAANIQDTDNVLVAGCATGYTAALVARLAARATATEVDPALAAKARDILAQLGFDKATVRPAHVAERAPPNAPYDGIVLHDATQLTPQRPHAQLPHAGRPHG